MRVVEKRMQWHPGTVVGVQTQIRNFDLFEVLNFILNISFQIFALSI